MGGQVTKNGGKFWTSWDPFQSNLRSFKVCFLGFSLNKSFALHCQGFQFSQKWSVWYFSCVCLKFLSIFGESSHCIENVSLLCIPMSFIASFTLCYSKSLSNCLSREAPALFPGRSQGTPFSVCPNMCCSYTRGAYELEAKDWSVSLSFVCPVI